MNNPKEEKKMKMRNKTVTALMMAGMVLMSAAYPTQVLAEETAVETLTIGMSKDQSTITPFTYINGTPGFDVMRFIYDSLFTIDENNEAVPWMVEEMCIRDSSRADREFYGQNCGNSSRNFGVTDLSDYSRKKN